MGWFDWLLGKSAAKPEKLAPGAERAEPIQFSISSASSAPLPPAPAPASEKPMPAPSVVPPPIDPPGTLDLNAANFLPISDSELANAAKDVRRGGAWFGRRDLIPPVSDLRTLLIDRGMVTHGLLTPEQLKEIHEVGAEMEHYRPTVDLAGMAAARAGTAAVEALQEARAKIKAQKKAEAAARRKARADAVLERKATDIVYLGRGVSRLLGERTSNVDKLQSLGLPVLSTPAELAAALGLTVPRLRWLAFHNEVATRVHYVSFTVPKKSGGTRRLSAPHRTLAAAQRWIRTRILDHLPVEAAAHGFVHGRSTVTNAWPHIRRAFVVNLDLADFFPSIGLPRVRSVFQRAGYSPAVATILALLCTECPRRTVTYDGRVYHVATGPRGLPQGASTSPALSNQVARRLDRRLDGLARKMSLIYTRYADDLTFSGGEELASRIGYLMARVRHIAEAEGFQVNEKKSRVQRRSMAQTVTGLVVNERPGVNRALVRRLRAILHRASHEGLDAQNREERPHFRAWLRGMIAYVSMVRPETGAALQAALDVVQ